MSSEERKPKSTLPIQEAIGCEIFMLLYVFHVIYVENNHRPLKAVDRARRALIQNFVDLRIKVLPSSGLALQLEA